MNEIHVKEINSTVDGVGNDIKGQQFASFEKLMSEEMKVEKPRGRTVNTVIIAETKTASGKPMFEKIGSNTTLVHGMQLPYMKSFFLPQYVNPVDNASQLYVDKHLGVQPGNEDGHEIVSTGDRAADYSYVYPKLDQSDIADRMTEALYDTMTRRIFGYGFSVGGASGGLVIPVGQNETGFNIDTMLPFEVIDSDDDTTKAEMLANYAGRVVSSTIEGEQTVHRTKYYIKKIKPNDIALTVIGNDGAPVPTTMSAIDNTKLPLTNLVKIKMSVSRTELRSFFKDEEGTDLRTRFSGISLFSGLEYGFKSDISATDFHKVLVTNRANVSSQSLGKSGDISIIFSIYYK